MMGKNGKRKSGIVLLKLKCKKRKKKSYLLLPCLIYRYAWKTRSGIEMHIAKCRDAPGNYIDAQQSFVFVEVTSSTPTLAQGSLESKVISKDTEVLIKLGNGENLCWERWQRAVFLEPCDRNNSLQRWMAPNGNFNGNKFEISQKNFQHQCVSNDHHPSLGTYICGSSTITCLCILMCQPF